ncbi:MAG: DUF3795 domain-containing protein [Bacteroidota bacterium]
MKTDIPSILIAPCGMNCGICKAYLRSRNNCTGCNVESPCKPKHCLSCSIKLCAVRTAGARFCYDCKNFPCERLRHLDKRYRTRYFMSMIENLHDISRHGLDRFMESENIRRACPRCGNPVCVHNGVCYQCEKTAVVGLK